jgi:hypothetical protein
VIALTVIKLPQDNNIIWLLQLKEAKGADSGLAKPIKGWAAASNPSTGLKLRETNQRLGCWKA